MSFSFAPIDLVGVIGILLLDLVPELVLAAVIFRTGNDLIVDASDDFFDDLSGRKGGKTGQSDIGQSKFLHRSDVGRRTSWACGQTVGLGR